MQRMRGVLGSAALFALTFLTLPPFAAQAEISCDMQTCAGGGSGDFPEEVCRPIYGMCPKGGKPLKHFATSCNFPKPYQVNKSTYVDVTAGSDGYPSWAKRPGDGALARVVNHAGSGGATAIANTRLSGDDGDAATGASCGGTYGQGRQGAFPCIIKKEDKFCKWWGEMAHNASNAIAAAARCPDTVDSECKRGGTPRLAYAVPEVVCRAGKVTPPDPMATASTYDGKQAHPGAAAAMEAARSSVDPNQTRLFSGLDDPLRKRPLTKAASFRAPDHSSGNSSGGEEKGFHKYFDKRKPTTLASAKLFLKTLAYETYDPANENLEDERQLAQKLAEKPPHEVIAMREKDGGWLDAYAAGPGSLGKGLEGIMCKTYRDCQYTSNYDKNPGQIKESFFTGLMRDNKISTPGIEFMPNLAQQFTGLLDQLKGMGGNLMEGLFQNLLKAGKDKGKKPQPPKLITRNELINCLNAMRIPVENNDAEQLRSKARQINARCPKNLLQAMQALGGYSEENLNIAFQTINQTKKSPNQAGKNSNMSDVGNFLFNGNPAQNIGGLTAFNLDSLGGANVSQLSNMLMQKLKIPGMPSIGGLTPPKLDKFLGNIGQMPKTIGDMKSNPFLQDFFGQHPFYERAAMNMAPERDAYSRCTNEKQCHPSKTEAGFAMFAPYYQGKDHKMPSISEDEYRKMIKEHTNLQNIISQFCQGAKCDPKAIGAVGSIPDLKKLFPGAGLPSLGSLGKSVGKFASLPKSTQEMLSQYSGYLPALINNDMNDPNNPNSPLHFGPVLTHHAIGMPETNFETGPVHFRKDGSAYYANMPDKHLNFIDKDQYTLADVDKGYLPKAFANFVPETTQDPWDRLALVIGHTGGIDFMPPERIQQMADNINRKMRLNGLSAFITPEILRQSAADFVTLAEKYTIEPPAPLSPKARELSSMLEILGVQDAHAFFASSGASKKAPPLPPPPPPTDSNDAVRCTGNKDFNQIRTDIISTRYDRYNGHLLQRVTYDRWAYTDGMDRLRCTPNHVCAPKPCPGRMPAWHRACWKETHGGDAKFGKLCTFPAIRVGPSDENPLAQVRYDYGVPQNDIAHYRPINNLCKKIPSPLHQPVSGQCHNYDNICPQTRAYNQRVYPGGKKLKGYTWAYHPDVKMLLTFWDEEMGGDFTAEVGERHMLDECKVLSAGMPISNKHKFMPMQDAAAAGIGIPSGSSPAMSFGPRKPYLIDDATGMVHGQKPGMPEDPLDSTGAYIFATSSDIGADALQQLAKRSPISSPPQNAVAKLLNRLAPSAVAKLPSLGGLSSGASGGNSSAMPCGSNLAGMDSSSDPSCPQSQGVDPASDRLMENLLTVRAIRNYGLNCKLNERFLWANSTAAMVSAKNGAQIAVPIDDSEESAGMVRYITFPDTGCQNFLHPDGWTSNCGKKYKEETGGSKVIGLGAEEATGVIIGFPDGIGGGQPTGEDSEYNYPFYGIVEKVNQEKGFISIWVNNTGGFPDSAMQTTSGEHILLTLYQSGKKSGLKKCYEVRPEQAAACELTGKDWSQGMRVYIPEDEEE